MGEMEGIYVSYDEKKRGDIGDAIKVAKNEYLIWRSPSAVRRKLRYPTKVIIRIKGQERYYRGDLLAIVDYEAFKPEFLRKYFRHRPTMWEKTSERNWKSVFFITNLQAVKRPNEIRGKQPPQSITYFKFFKSK